MISEFLLNISHKLYKRRLEKARICSYRCPLFFPSGRARELMRYIKNGQSMFVLMAPYSKGTFCVSAKSIDRWDVDGGNELATDEEKREVLKAAVEYLKNHGKKVVIIDPQPWQIENLSGG